MATKAEITPAGNMRFAPFLFIGVCGWDEVLVSNQIPGSLKNGNRHAFAEASAVKKEKREAPIAIGTGCPEASGWLPFF